MKEQSIAEVQQQLWGNVNGKQTVSSRFADAKKGRIPNGLNVSEIEQEQQRLSGFLGDFAPRVVLLASPSSNHPMEAQDIAAIGGWCAIRTRDLIDFNQGKLSDVRTGETKPIITVQDVTGWLEASVTFDQVVDSIGAVNAAEYAAISEQRLWTEKITEKVRKTLNKNSLSPKEQQEISDAVIRSELTRAVMTERYLEYVLQKNKIVFRRFTDESIWEELQEARDEVLRKTSSTLSGMQQNFPQEADILPSSTIVWTMYTQPYTDVLRNNGIISKQTTYIAEPTFHASTNESKAKASLVFEINKQGRYFDKNGWNNQTGFAAYMECLSPSGKSARVDLPAGQVPNISNWQDIFSSGGLLSPDNNQTIVPGKNNLFVWALNMLPYNETRQALLQLVAINTAYTKDWQAIQSQFPVNGRDEAAIATRQQQKNDLERKYMTEVCYQNQIIANELCMLFRYMVQDI